MALQTFSKGLNPGARSIQICDKNVDLITDDYMKLDLVHKNNLSHFFLA